MEDLTLIKCVKKYPQVYDSTTQEFKNLEEKQNAWLLISSEMKFDGLYFETLKLQSFLEFLILN